MISAHVKTIIDTTKQDIEDRSGIVFNHHDVIDRIKAYRNQQFSERQGDAIFWDLGTSRAQHFAKNIDLDTKDLTPYGVGEVSFVQVMILRMKMYKWMEENKYALSMDYLSDELADFGSCIFKRIKKKGQVEVQTLNISNMYFNVLTNDFVNTDKVELHFMTEPQVKKMKEWKGSDKVEYTDGIAEIWEYWGWYEDEYVQAVGFGHGDKSVDLLMENRKETDQPYSDFHIGPYKGRFLRKGVYERLFIVQERTNQLVNKNAETQDIASTLLLRSGNADLEGNVLTDAVSGDIINDASLEQIGIDNRSLNAFIQEMQMLENQADKLAFTPEVITGENMPSGTPFRSVAITSSSAKSTFKKIKEYYGEQMGYFMKEHIFPSVVKGWNAKDFSEIARDEMDVRIYHKQLKKLQKWETFVTNMLKGKIVTLEDMQGIDAAFEEKAETVVPRIKIPKNFFNFDYLIRTNVTSEQVDKRQMNDAMFNAIQMVQANPAIVNMPLFKQYVENNGINYWRLTPEQVEEIKGGATGASQPIGKPEDKLLAAAEA